MALWFAELDRQETPLGVISLRRRQDATAGKEVYEVKLDDEYLMSSLFTVAEAELASLALAELDRSQLRVLVGGLGLGYTAMAALGDPRVDTVTVIESAEPVLDWHRRQLLPEAAGLSTDTRCHLVHGDFFAVIGQEPDDPYDAILLDIDHSPQHVLHPSHQAFYSAAALTRLARHLTEGGVFALWSDDPPDPDFESVLGQVFTSTAAHVVRFANPLTGGESSNTVYVARHPGRNPA